MKKIIFLIAPLIFFLSAFSIADAAEKKEKEKKVIHSTQPIDYVGLKNPLTTADPKTLPDNDPNILAGKKLYEATCTACHGEKSDGKGPDPEAIAKLDQGYILWRINEGGLSDPFYSAMPAWMDDFTETEKWQLILYMYKNAGVSPKAKK